MFPHYTSQSHHTIRNKNEINDEQQVFTLLWMKKYPTIKRRFLNSEPDRNYRDKTISSTARIVIL